MFASVIFSAMIQGMNRSKAMDKLTMAHQMALAIQGTKLLHDMELVSEMAWKYADAMQAEADKRITEVRIDDVSEEHANALREACEKEWQPDWSQASELAKAWTRDRFGGQWWDTTPSKGIDLWITDTKVPYKCENAPDFNYQGAWQDSLRKRPK